MTWKRLDEIKEKALERKITERDYETLWEFASFSCPIRYDPRDCDGHNCPMKPDPVCGLSHAHSASCYDDYYDECVQALFAKQMLRAIADGAVIIEDFAVRG